MNDQGDLLQYFFPIYSTIRFAPRHRQELQCYKNLLQHVLRRTAAQKSLLQKLKNCLLKEISDTIDSQVNEPDCLVEELMSMQVQGLIVKLKYGPGLLGLASTFYLDKL